MGGILLFLKSSSYCDMMLMHISIQTCLSAASAKVRHPMWRSVRSARGNVEDFF